MTMSPKPTPIPQDVRVFLVGCDNCGQYIEMTEDDSAPPPWREVVITGWVGVFHACSDDCEAAWRERVEGG